MSTLITEIMYLVKVLFFKTACSGDQPTLQWRKCGLQQGFFVNLDGSSANV